MTTEALAELVTTLVLDIEQASAAGRRIRPADTAAAIRRADPTADVGVVLDLMVAVLRRRAAEHAAHARELRACGALIEQTPGARTLADVEATLGRAEMVRRLNALLDQATN